MLAVDLQHLTKRYGQVTAVDDLSLQIAPGEIVAFLGPNGAGKTTTVDMLLGLARPDGGVVQVYGKSPAQARNRLYYICQKIGITKEKLGVTPYGLRHAHANDLYEEVAGEPSVVRGGSACPDRAGDEIARRTVSLDLGHERTSITSSYIGARQPGRPRLSADKIPPVANDSETE